MIAGHAVLELLLVLALVGGLGSVLVKPAVSGGVGAVGAVILLWMGLDMLRGLPRLKLDWQASGPGGPESYRAPLRDGFLLSLANPYWSLWWSTVGLSLMALVMKSGLAWLGVAALFIGHISGDLAWYTLISLVVAKGRRWLTDRLHRAVVGVCAGFLLVFAVYFGIFAWRQLAGLAE
jgi:threonine/homoserine/homoserine lactone efflux protein